MDQMVAHTSGQHHVTDPRPRSGGVDDVIPRPLVNNLDDDGATQRVVEPTQPNSSVVGDRMRAQSMQNPLPPIDNTLLLSTIGQSESEYPLSAKFWIDGAHKKNDPKSLGVEAIKVLPWLVDAIIHAHHDGKTKHAAVQLMLVHSFTTNLSFLGCWVPLRTALIAHLTTLGASLHDRYNELDLGTQLSDQRVGCDKLQYHSLLPNHHQGHHAPLTHVNLLPHPDNHFDFSNDHLENMDERALLIVILMISQAVDAIFQQKTQTIVPKSESTELRGAPIKQYARALNKALSDHLGKPQPRTAYNIDTVRALLEVSDPTAMIEAFRLLVKGFDGVAKVKNLFVLPEDERIKKFDLLTLMVTVVVDSGMTFGEMTTDARCQQLFDAFTANVPHSEPPERWERLCKRAHGYLSHPSIANEKVCTYGEIQIILKDDARVRHAMHLVYKVVRAETSDQLYQDFLQSYGKRPMDVQANTLHNATGQGQLSIVAALLAGGADVDSSSNTDGNTPLFIAVQWNHPDVVKLLIDQRAAVNKPDNTGTTPLFIAASRNSLDVTKLLISNHASIDQANNDGLTPLHIASLHKHLEVVKCLVSNNASIDQADNGTTPLHIASHKNHFEVVMFLVSNNASVDQADNDGTTPLLGASLQNHLEVVKLLVSSNASIDQADNDGITPLLGASHQNHLEVVKFLVSSNASIDQANNNGVTPLYIASLQNHLEIVKFLVSSNASIDQANNNRTAPLYIASQKNHLEVVKCLVANNASIDQIDNNGCASLHTAAAEGYLEIVKVLVEAGADLNVNGKSGTPLKEAINDGKVNVVEYLQQHDALVEYTDC